MRRALRARLYVPKSVDATETTVLTPRAGAPHGDALQVATVRGLSGYQPYLHRVVGRAGGIDPLTKKVDVGGLRLVLGDVRIDPGNADPVTAEVQRWVTAFVGDSANRWQLPACRVEVDECLDWDGSSGTWTRYFTGRTDGPATAEGLILRGLGVKDLSADLRQPAFEGAPAAGVSYAKRGRLWPVGMPVAYGDLSAQAPIACTISTFAGLSIIATPASSAALPAKLVTKRLASLGVFDYGTGFPAWDAPAGARLYITWTGGTGAPTGTTSSYRLTNCTTERYNPTNSNSARYITAIYGRLFDIGATVPTASDWTGNAWIEAATGSLPTRDDPLVIGNVHPVQLWQDLLDGSFGLLDDSGDPYFPVAYDAAAFAALIADPSFPTVRFLIDERAKSMQEFIEQEICQPFHLTYYLNAEGEVVPVSLRAPTSAPTVTALTDDDLLARNDRAQWKPDGEAVAYLRGEYYLDSYLSDSAISSITRDPDVPSTRVTSTPAGVVVVSGTARLLDLPRQPLEVTSRGLRGFLSEIDTSGIEREAVIQQQFEILASNLESPYGLGATFAVLLCARGTGRAAEGLVPGDWVSIDSRALENPETCERGGARLMRVVEVSDEGESGIVRRLTCLDMGPDAYLGAPSSPTAASVVGTPAETSAVVRFTMPAAFVPTYLRIERDGATWGADVTVTAAASATQDVTVTGLDPGTTYSIRARGIGPTGAAAANPSPAASVTTAGASTIPTPTLSGYVSGSVHVLEIAPGVGSPSGVTWVIQQDGVDYDTSLDTSYLALPSPGTWDWTVYGTKAGFIDSAVSNTVTLP